MKLTKSLLGTSAVLSGAMLLTAQDAAAQSASAQAMLEEVVVTARRREENLQDLPLSIAAINADAMQAQGIYSIEDVSDFVPNVTLTTSDRASNTRVIIRGIGGGHPDPAFVFGAGMYIDGHYIPNSLGGYMSTMDIERVELLRGPQGTLFGKNVTGGAVNIISAKPGPDFDSSVTLRAAEDGDNDFRGMVNFPISENVFARVGIAKEVFDGYYYNRHLDTMTGGEDHTTINGALRFTPGNWTIDVNAFLIEMRDDNKGGQCSFGDGNSPQWGGEFGGDPDAVPPIPPDGDGHLDRIEPGFKQEYYDYCNPANPNSDAAQGLFVSSSDKATFADIDQEAVFVAAQWDSPGAVGGLEDLTVKISGSYRYNDYDYLQDRDYNFYDIDTIGEVATDTKGAGFGSIGQDNWTRGAELLVEGTVNDRLEFTAGINYFYELAKNGDGSCRQEFLDSGFADSVPNPAYQAWLDGGQVGDQPNPIAPAVGTGDEGIFCAQPSGLYFELLPFPRFNGGGPGPFLNSSRIENESIGVFGHVTYALNDNWDLDVGARWTEDDRNFWNMESPTEGCITADNRDRVLGDPATTGPTNICDLQYFMSWNNVINDGFFNASEATFDEITPMVSLTRNLAGGGMLDDGMVYFLYSEGFLTGGFNLEINSNVPGIESLLHFEPESVKNYEVGFKGTLADGRVRIMADVFYMDYANRQDQIDIPNPDGAFGIDDPLGVVQNVSSVDVTGLELELRASPWDGGFVSVDLGLLDNEYGEYIYPNPSLDNDPDACPAGQASGSVCDLSNTLINDLTPDWTLNFGVEHEFQLGNGGTLTPRLNIYMSDGIEYQEGLLKSESPGFCYQDSYERLGARVTYVPPAGNWQASLFGQNITDEEIYERCGDTRGVYTYRHERPAYWGVEFQARWGAGAN